MKRNILTALTFLLILPLAAPGTAQAKDREINVTGSCSRDVTTDRGTVTITAEAQESDLKAAVKKATRAYDRALDSIKKLKLENADLKTVEYSVNEVKEWEKNKSVSKGFRARIGLQVSTSDIQRLGEVTEVASREEIRDVGSLSTYLSDEKLLKEQTLCLKEAAEHAREKAEKLASTLGAHLGEVLKMSENNTSSPSARPVPIMARAMLQASENSAPAPSVQSGQQQVTATVQVVFALK